MISVHTSSLYIRRLTLLLGLCLTIVLSATAQQKRSYSGKARAKSAQSRARTTAVRKSSTGKTTRYQKPRHSFSVSESGSDRIYTIDGVSFKMVGVEGGTFTMGYEISYSQERNDAAPEHKVTLSSYYIGKTEVTQALWIAVMGRNPSRFIGVDLPVENVSWDDCQVFIRKLNAITGEHFRLPTEAEWEYAARGGRYSRGFSCSGSPSAAPQLYIAAWYEENSRKRTHPVDTKADNELGLSDMSGNVWEWCQDYYGTYESEDQTNPTGPASGRLRVNRGGSWASGAASCYVSKRGANSPGDASRYDDVGLRLAL